MTLGQGSRLNLPKQQEVEKNTQNKQKKIYKKEDWRESRIYKMHQKEISNKAKKSETAKTKISGLNNRVRCNKNTKLTKKAQNPRACSAPKKEAAARIGKNRKVLKN